MIVEFPLKSGELYTIREAESDDAANLLNYINQVSGESDNLTFGPGEFNLSLLEEKRFIYNIKFSDNAIFFVAVLNGEIIGNIGVHGGGRSKVRHNAEIGITVKKNYWRNGVASRLFEVMLQWAQQSPIAKLNLRVKEDNLGAISLYKKFGFEVEGTIRRDFRIGDRYYSSYFMGKLI